MSFEALLCKPLRVIERRMDRDDVLFKFKNSPEVVQVHLTWGSSLEDDPKWPISVLYASINEWVDQVMISESKEFI